MLDVVQRLIPLVVGFLSGVAVHRFYATRKLVRMLRMAFAAGRQHERFLRKFINESDDQPSTSTASGIPQILNELPPDMQLKDGG